jgi:hypothetical protein
MKKRRPEVDPITLFRRRAALGLSIFLQLCVVVGAQGAWWDVIGQDGVVAYTHHGHDATRAVSSMEPAAAIAAVAAVVAFFFASYDLVADADLQAPILLASLLALGAAASAFHRAIIDPATINAITREVMEAGASTAAVSTTGAPPARELLLQLPSLRPAWGLALFAAAAPLMVVVSTYLTFFSVRSPEQP